MFIRIFLTIFIINLILAFYFKTKNPAYRFKKQNLIEYLADYFFMPFMELATGGKDSHWWDWEFISSSEISKNIKTLKYESQSKALRVFKRYPIVGQYNLSGLRSLYITLFVLPDVAIIKPKVYKDDWLLISKGGHDADNNLNMEYAICRFILNGPVKYLVDGPQEFLGKTLDNKFIELEIVEITSRHSLKNYLFI